MKASLAIVAAAPLVAEARVSNGTQQMSMQIVVTGSEWVVNTGLVTAHSMLDCFVRRKVNGMCRS